MSLDKTVHAVSCALEVDVGGDDGLEKIKDGWNLDLKIYNNKIAHNTRQYNRNAIIARRGGSVTFTVSHYNNDLYFTLSLYPLFYLNNVFSSCIDQFH